MLTVLGVALSSTSSAQTIAKIKLECLSFGSKPMLECTVHLSNGDGTPLSGGRVVLSASMPSMPMAHYVRPVVALPIEKPGEYRGTLELEMPGVWAIQVDISKPRRERLVQSLRVELCESGKRCLAQHAGQTNKSHR
jgi:hypothetical protein